MENKSINSQIEELKKGCGKGFYSNKGRAIEGQCGHDGRLCPNCQSKLSTLQEAQKMFLEEIDRRLNSIKYRIRTGFGTKEDYIGEIETLQELKSKIGGEDETK